MLDFKEKLDNMFQRDWPVVKGIAIVILIILGICFAVNVAFNSGKYVKTTVYQIDHYHNQNAYIIIDPHGRHYAIFDGSKQEAIKTAKHARYAFNTNRVGSVLNHTDIHATSFGYYKHPKNGYYRMLPRHFITPSDNAIDEGEWNVGGAIGWDINWKNSSNHGQLWIQGHHYKLQSWQEITENYGTTHNHKVYFSGNIKKVGSYYDED